MPKNSGTKDLFVQHVGDETIIFDRRNQVAHRVSRRDFMRNAGFAASAILAVPIIDSLTVPVGAAPEPGGCRGRHLATVVSTGGTKRIATNNVYAASYARAEEVCRTFECDGGDCVSTGHPFYPLKPSCSQVGDAPRERTWKCTLKYSAVCTCKGS